MEATGGGWPGPPDDLAPDGGSQADFVDITLQSARQYALDNNIPVGKEFTYTITDIPKGITSPYEIIAGLMMQAGRYGLAPGILADETIRFTRLN